MSDPALLAGGVADALTSSAHWAHLPLIGGGLFARLFGPRDKPDPRLAEIVSKRVHWDKAQKSLLAGQAAVERGAFSEADELFAAAAHDFRRADDPVAVLRTSLGSADMARLAGRLVRAREAYGALIHADPGAIDDGALANAYLGLARVETRAGRLALAQAAAEGALGLARSVQDRLGEGWALLEMRRIADARGHHDDARVQGDAARTRFEWQNAPGGLLQCRLVAMRACVRRGRADAALAELDAIRALCADDSSGRFKALATLALAQWRARFAAPAKARAGFEEAQQRFLQLGDGIAQREVRLDLAEHAACAGDREEACKRYDALIAESVDSARAEALLARARLDLRMGAPFNALTRATEALSLFEAESHERGLAETLIVLADALRRDRPDRARSLYYRAASACQAIGDDLAKDVVMDRARALDPG